MCTQRLAAKICFLFFVSLGIGAARGVWAESSYQCRKTNSSMFFWGEAKINGHPVAKGDTVIAIIPNVETNGGCVGVYVVNKPGNYGAIAVYEDDPTTPEKDGARAGDKIYFQTIEREIKGKHEFQQPVIWKGNGQVERLDISAK